MSFNCLVKFSSFSTTADRTAPGVPAGTNGTAQEAMESNHPVSVFSQKIN